MAHLSFMDLLCVDVFVGQKSEVFVSPTRKRGAAAVGGCFCMQTSERCIPSKGAQERGSSPPTCPKICPDLFFFQ